MTTYAKPRFRIEVHAPTSRAGETWEPLYGAGGKRYTFVEQKDADAMLARVKRVQPHVQFRIAPM